MVWMCPSLAWKHIRNLQKADTLFVDLETDPGVRARVFLL